MSLIVEDGTGRADAQSLVSVSEADTYHRQRGNTEWAAISVPEKERYLILANDYLQQMYRSRWKGCIKVSTQACAWPRYSVCVEGHYVDDTSVPRDVKNACCELADRVRTQGSLNPDYEQPVKREKVGPIETEYADYTTSRPQYNAVDGILNPYLIGGNSISASLVRT